MLKKMKTLYDLEQIGTHTVWFYVKDMDSDTDGDTGYLSLTKENWTDMGSPQLITVTIKPGDRLN